MPLALSFTSYRVHFFRVSLDLVWGSHCFRVSCMLCISVQWITDDNQSPYKQLREFATLHISYILICPKAGLGIDV